MAAAKKTSPKAPSVAANTISVRGAREHNLKNISVVIPRDKLVALTGLSGSGKSSLAFDTIYAEGQRRYVESLSSYARQFLGQMDKPDVDVIEGLSPAISIDQKTASKNPRSTVGTITEVYDYLRLLWARIGIQHCWKDGAQLQRQTPQQIVDRILELEDGTRFQILAPVVRGRKGEYETLLNDLMGQGYSRARVDGVTVEISEFLKQDQKLARYENHSIEVIVDRLVRKGSISRRLTDSLETALKLAEGVAEVEIMNAKNPDEQGETITFSQHLACPKCGTSYDELAPRNFSFNSPFGACEACLGLGTKFEVDVDLIVPDAGMSINEGAISPWRSAHTQYFTRMLEAVAEEYNIDLDKPWSKLSEKHRNLVLNGVGDSMMVKYKNRYGRTREYSTAYEGVIPWIKRRHESSESDNAREQFESYMREADCPACKGERLRPSSLAVKVNKHSISQVCDMSIAESAAFLKELVLGDRDTMIAERITKEVNARLGFLLDVGLDYLTLSRPAATLAGGEAQRIRLATQIGSGLVGVLYVLDEPSIGLHQRDNKKLIDTLIRLRNLGNTLIVVEHDEETIRAADWVVDIGPGAGEHGGYVVSSGTVADLESNKKSITGDYISGRKSVVVPKKRRPIDKERMVRVVEAQENNLKKVTVEFPLGVFVAVTGVSGSGKSTLVNDILYSTLARDLHQARIVPGQHKKVEGIKHLDKVVHVDQSPIGRTPRSNPATYTGVFDNVRKLFAETSEAKIRGYQPGRFSFNVKGGRCEPCSGDGTIQIEMNFLPDVYVPCEVCQGARYNRDTLEVHYKGKTVSDVLNMPIEQALVFFESVPAIARHLKTLVDVGLGYVRLGQSAPTLSGGEAQRVKLATELQRRSTGRTIYVLDEPTTGLHFEDVRKLLGVLERLVDSGNTVIVIEHNLDVIKNSDWVIDMGPEGGFRGGTVVAQGTPEQIAKSSTSYTGKYLAQILKNSPSKVG